MISQEAKEIIENNPVAFATMTSDGKPNVIGVAHIKVVSKDEIIITDNYMRQTKENLEKDNNICLAVWNKDWRGYKLIGTAAYFQSGKWMDFIKNMPENEGLPAKGAILIKLSSLINLK